MTVRKSYYDNGRRPMWFVPGGGSYDPARDSRPVSQRRNPVYHHILVMNERGGACSSCSRRLLPGDEYYVTRMGSLRHAQCSLQG